MAPKPFPKPAAAAPAPGAAWLRRDHRASRLACLLLLHAAAAAIALTGHAGAKHAWDLGYLNW